MELEMGEKSGEDLDYDRLPENFRQTGGTYKLISLSWMVWRVYGGGELSGGQSTRLALAKMSPKSQFLDQYQPLGYRNHLAWLENYLVNYGASLLSVWPLLFGQELRRLPPVTKHVPWIAMWEIILVLLELKEPKSYEAKTIMKTSGSRRLWPIAI